MKKGALALLAVLGLKAAVLLQLGSHPLLAPEGGLDAAYYFKLASAVAHGDLWLSSPISFDGHPPPAFFVSPLYVYVLALILKVFNGSLEAARWAQILLGTAAVWLLATTARRWYGDRAAWITGALAALCGLFTFFEVVIFQTALDPFLTALDLYVLTRAIERDRLGSWALAGATLGLHALNRPNMLVVLGLLAILIASRRLVERRSAAGGAPRAALIPAVAFAFAGVVAIAPATARNWRVAHDFVPISSHGGLNFLIGNGPEADGTFRRVSGIEPSIRGQWLDAPALVRDAVGHDPSASEVSSFFLRRSLRWIREHPAAELALLARKGWYTLSATFLTLDHSFPFFARDLSGPLSWLIVGPMLIVPLGLVGLWLGPSRRGHWLLVAFAMAVFVSIALFFVASRYRVPLQIALTVPAGGAAARIIDWLRARRWRQAAITAGAAAVCASVVAWPTGLDDGRAEERVRMAILAVQQGRSDEGETWLQLAIDRRAYPGVAHLRVGQAYESIGRPLDAIGHYQRAASFDPNDPSVRFVLRRAYEQRGLALISNGDTAEALRAFEDAIRVDASVPSEHLNYAVALATAGRLDQARTEAETALRLDPGYTKAKEFLEAIKK